MRLSTREAARLRGCGSFARRGVETWCFVGGVTDSVGTESMFVLCVSEVWDGVFRFPCLVDWLLRQGTGVNALRGLEVWVWMIWCVSGVFSDMT
jgi:hypothetical protein